MSGTGMSCSLYIVALHCRKLYGKVLSNLSNFLIFDLILMFFFVKQNLDASLHVSEQKSRNKTISKLDFGITKVDVE